MECRGNILALESPKGVYYQSRRKSLERLRTDYIDLYQLHGGTIDDPIEETIEAFETLVASGKIRYYGLSSIRPNVIRKWLELSNITSVMVQYSLADRRPEEWILPELSQNQVGVLIRGALAQGLLINKELQPYLDYDVNSLEKIRNGMDFIPASRTAVALQYVAMHPAVASVITGIRTNVQLNDILTAIDTRVSKKELEALGKILEPNRYKEHR